MKFVNKDCFDYLPTIAPESVDLAVCDLPYGTTQCKWDSVLPLADFWTIMWRALKPQAPIVMFASQPFTSVLLLSQAENFRYEWIWEKSKASNFLDAKKRPLKAHESILVFCRKTAPYFPQMTIGEPYKARAGKKVTDVYGSVKDNMFRNDNEGNRYPRSVIYFKTAESEGKPIHSTQKPVALVEYLISTYTKDGGLVLYPCAGSCTTGVASKRLNRNFVGCEKDEAIYAAAAKRLEENVIINEGKS